MPLNKKGGKGHKKCKNNINREYNKILEVKEEGEAYGIVNKILGGGRMAISYYDEEAKNIISVLGIVRGAIKKRTRFTLGCLILVSIRDFQKDKADIIYKYSINDVNQLKKRGEIPSLLLGDVVNSLETIEFINEDEDEDVLEIAPQRTKIKSTSYGKLYESLGIISDDEEEVDPIDLI